MNVFKDVVEKDPLSRLETMEDINDVMQSHCSDPIISLRNLVKVYSTGAGKFTALNGINLDFPRGEFVGILGKSGAGKTTLLNTISGVSEITSGEVLYFEQNGNHPHAEQKAVSVRTMKEDELAVWRGRNIGIVYQSFELMPQLNLVKNVMLPQDFSGLYKPRTSTERALELLEMVELVEHAYKLPAHISGGQRQRVAIARALVNDPAVILADEPTGNLDTVTAERIIQIFEKLVQQGKTLIMVSHDNNLASRFSRVVYISDGEIVNSYGGNGSSGEKTSQQVKPFSETLADMAAAETAHLATDTEGLSAEVKSEVIEKTASSSRDLEESPLLDHANLLNNNGSGNHTFRAPSEPAILLHDVVKTYVNAAGEFTALKGINLEMCYGQFISIVGKSGSGKSTLLNMLTGIDHPTSGQVIVGGEDIYKMSESRRALWRGRNIGIVFQFFQLLPTLTLLENTMLPMDYCNIYAANERPQRALELLKAVGLEDHAHKLPASVSSGQQQSAAIARALATDPPIIVADEPTGNLDSRSADKILRLFSELAAQGKTILIVTHDPSFTRRTDQTVILSDGEIIDDAVARALPMLNHPQMLHATHVAEKRTYPAGSVIIRQGERVDHLFMVSGGEIEVVLKNPGCPEISLARMAKGQFFGEIELIHNNDSIASVRASSNSPVELSLLPKQEFFQLLHGSPQAQEILEEVAQKRLEENLAQNGGCED